MQNSQSKYQWVMGLSKQEASFMAQMPFTLTVPGLCVVIAHAGLVPGVPTAQQRLQDVYRVSILPTTPDNLLMEALSARAKTTPPVLCLYVHFLHAAAIHSCQRS